MNLNPVTGLKICPGCKDQFPEGKSAAAFYGNRAKKDGLTNSCRKCTDIFLERYKDKHNARTQAHQKKNPKYYIVKHCSYRAVEKSLPCTITEDDVHIPDNCPLCKVQLEQGRENINTSPSADMYDPRLGYIPGNFWVICMDCNRRKQDMTGEDHIAFGIQLIDAFKEHCDGVA